MNLHNNLEPNPLLSEEKTERIERIAEYLEQGTLVQNSSRPKLVNGEKRHRKYPLTFPLPSKNKRNNVPPRSFVKAMFSEERFFVEILECFEEEGEKKYAGVVSNDIQCQSDIDFGSPVIVEPKHILDIKDNSAGVMDPPEKTWKWTHETVNEI